MKTLSAAIMVLVSMPALAQAVRQGPDAFGDWHSDAVGVIRHISPADLPQPAATASASRGPRVVPRPAGTMPVVPPGFTVQIWATGLNTPPGPANRTQWGRLPRGEWGRRGAGLAPIAGCWPPRAVQRVRLGPWTSHLGLRSGPRITRAMSTSRRRRGWCDIRMMAAWLRPALPKRSSPNFLRAATGRGIWRSRPTAPRSTCRSGRRPTLRLECDLRRRGPKYQAYRPQHGALPLGRRPAGPPCSAFGPEGGPLRLVASGLRNCVGLAVQPRTQALWCVTNERDGMGDNLPPDYATRVAPGNFFGWPWYYIGANEDPRHRGERPDLANQVTVPDVLFQAHSAPLGIAFYQGSNFPRGVRGRCLRHPAWELEPGAADGLQSRSPSHAG